MIILSISLAPPRIPTPHPIHVSEVSASKKAHCFRTTSKASCLEEKTPREMKQSTGKSSKAQHDGYEPDREAFRTHRQATQPSRIEWSSSTACAPQSYHAQDTRGYRFMKKCEPWVRQAREHLPMSRTNATCTDKERSNSHAALYKRVTGTANSICTALPSFALATDIPYRARTRMQEHLSHPSLPRVKTLGNEASLCTQWLLEILI